MTVSVDARPSRKTRSYREEVSTGWKLFATIPLWLVTCTVPLACCLLPWVLFPNQGCDLDGPRNWWWYSHVWDMAFNVFAICTTILTCLDCMLMVPFCTNWGWGDRMKIYPLMFIIGLSASVGVKYLYEWSGLLDGFWAWPLCKLVVVVACTFAYLPMLPFVMCRTSSWEVNKFFIWLFVLVYLLICWALALYYHNQLFGMLYKKGQAMILASKYAPYCSAYDLIMASLFQKVLLPQWTEIRKFMSRPLEDIMMPIPHDQVRFIFTVWEQSFDACFGRVLFGNVSSVTILVVLCCNDSLHHILVFAMQYCPVHMLSMAMMEVNCKGRWCYNFVVHTIHALLGFDADAVREVFLIGKHTIDEPGQIYDILIRSKILQLMPHEVKRLSSDPEIIRTAAEFGLRSSFVDNEGITSEQSMVTSKILKFEDAMKRYEVNTVDGSTTAPKHRSAELFSSLELDSLERELMPCEREPGETGIRPCEMRDIIDSLMTPKDGYTPMRLMNDEEIATLCARIVVVQKNLRLQVCATYAAHLTSSIIGLSFLFLREYYPCTLVAYGIPTVLTIQSKLVWVLCAICDVFECIIIFIVQHRQRIVEEDDCSWNYVSKVVWTSSTVIGAMLIAVHILQDTYVAMYHINF